MYGRRRCYHDTTVCRRPLICRHLHLAFYTYAWFLFLEYRVPNGIFFSSKINYEPVLLMVLLAGGNSCRKNLRLVWRLYGARLYDKIEAK
jgi:hypothetical protein